MPITEKHACPGCGVLVADGSEAPHPYIGANAGCWELCGQILAKEYENPDYWKNHRLTADAYAVQHPGVPERRAIQSVNAHLISLALIYEKGARFGEATAAIGTMIKKHKHRFSWLTPPTTSYDITVMDILKATSAEEHCALVETWAKHAWDMWAPHHGTILEYL